MLQFIESRSAEIQAVCSGLGLIGLAVYTSLTSSIRKATVRQAKASQRPLIVVDLLKGTKSKWLAHNKGNGPALQMFWKVGHTNDKQGWNKLGALAVNDFSDISGPTAAELLEMPETGLRIHYSDLAGNKYCTIMENGPITFHQDSFDLAQSECNHLSS